MKNRFLNLPNKVIAVTGGIASGKTTYCKKLEEKGKKVFYSDLIVKEIYEKQSVISYLSYVEDDMQIPPILKPVPFELSDRWVVDFSKLREISFNHPTLLKYCLEPLIRDHFAGEFLNRYMMRKLNIPKIVENTLRYEDIYLEHPLVLQMKIFPLRLSYLKTGLILCNSLHTY